MLGKLADYRYDRCATAYPGGLSLGCRGAVMNDKAEQLIYDHVFKELVNEGFQQSHAEQAGAAALRFYRRNTPHQKSIKQAIAQCKKAHKKVER